MGITTFRLDLGGSNALFLSDGTEEGTVLAEGVPGDAPSTVAGNIIFFVGSDERTGNELWRSDGTEAGTMLVKDIAPGPESSFQSSGFPTFIPVDDMVFFEACEPATGCELWRSDGTEAGTILVKDIRPGEESVRRSTATHQRQRRRPALQCQ